MIKNNNDGTYSVITEAGCFNIVSADAHTKQMLDSFLVEGSPELQQFEQIMAEHGVEKAYNIYNNIPEVPEEPNIF